MPAGWELDVEDASSVSFWRQSDQLAILVGRRNAVLRPDVAWQVDGTVESSFAGAKPLRTSLVDIARSYPDVTVQPGPSVRVLGRDAGSAIVHWSNPATLPGSCLASVPCPKLVVLKPLRVGGGPRRGTIGGPIASPGGDVIVTASRAGGFDESSLHDVAAVLASLRRVR